MHHNHITRRIFFTGTINNTNNEKYTLLTMRYNNAVIGMLK